MVRIHVRLLTRVSVLVKFVAYSSFLSTSDRKLLADKTILTFKTTKHSDGKKTYNLNMGLRNRT